MTDTVEKVPPNALEAEMSVLGAMLMNEAALEKATEMLVPGMFYNLSHRTIFAAVLELYAENQTVDVVAVSSRLRDMGKLDDVGGVVYLTDLVDTVSTTAHVDSWIHLIKDKACRRELLRIADQLKGAVSSSDRSEDVIEETERQLFQLTQDESQGVPTPTPQLVTRAVETLERRARGEVEGVTTGLKDLDAYARLVPRRLYILAGRPSMGKTSLALKMAWEASKEMQRPFAFFTLEMGEEDTMRRLICQQAHADMNHMESADWDAIGRAEREIGPSRIVIDDTTGLTTMQLRSRSRRYIRQYGVGLVVVDFLQLLRGTRRDYQPPHVMFTEIICDIQALANELAVPILVVSQLNRKAEERTDKKPMLADLRESGSIEQAADVVLLLYRDEYYFKNTTRKGEADIIVAKNRYGPCGTVEVLFFPEHTRFENLAVGEI